MRDKKLIELLKKYNDKARADTPCIVITPIGKIIQQVDLVWRDGIGKFLDKNDLKWTWCDNSYITSLIVLIPYGKEIGLVYKAIEYGGK